MESMSFTVLLIDDDPVTREPTSRLLRSSGFDVVRAANGRDALDLLERAHVDVALLDLIMPEMDGLSFLKILRKNHKFKDLPVLMVTALSDHEALRRAHRLGVNEYLIKTRFTPEQLVEAIHRQIAEAAQPRDTDISDVLAGHGD
jgi:CheY-like chemotaxis protein